MRARSTRWPGVLLVCLGQATRLVEYAQRLPKSYRATFLLGRRSETDDVEGDVEIVATLPSRPARDVEPRSRFAREISQRPPRHSAVKIAGRRAYKLARRRRIRAGAAKTSHRPARGRSDTSIPELVLEVECGSGTYIRSLGRDLAESL